MKDKTKLRTVVILVVVSIFVFFLLVTVVFENYMFPATKFVKRTHVEIDRSIDDLTVIKISHPYPKSHAFHVALNEVFIPEIKQNAGRHLQVEVYPDDQLGDPERQLLGVEHGSIELAVIPGTEMKKYAQFAMFSIPYFFPDYSDLRKFMDKREHVELFTEELAYAGLSYLDWSFEGYRHIMKTQPSSSFFSPDLVGVSSIETVSGNTFFQNNGLIPQTYSKEDLLGYVRDGSLPYAEISSSQYVNYNLNQVVRNIPFPKYLAVPSFFIANTSFWNNLAPAEKNLIAMALEKTLFYHRQLVVSEEKQFFQSIDSQLADYVPDDHYYINLMNDLAERGIVLPDYMLQYK